MHNSGPFAPMKLSSEHKSLYTLNLKSARETDFFFRPLDERVTVKVE